MILRQRQDAVTRCGSASAGMFPVQFPRQLARARAGRGHRRLFVLPHHYKPPVLALLLRTTGPIAIVQSIFLDRACMEKISRGP